MDKINIEIIKTDKCWFIKEILNNSWGNGNIENLYFNGNKPKQTFSKKWFQIEKPKDNNLIIEKEKKGEKINQRYVIKDKEYISNKLPEIIKYEDRDKYYDAYYEDYKILNDFYNYEYDEKEPYKQKIDFDYKILCEIENYEFPLNFEYEAIHRWNYKEEPYMIKRDSINHQEIDKIIFPEILLTNRPCCLSSKQMYDITRQYIKENIDNSIAKITSDYDFCFKVEKIVKLLEPETIIYNNIFARTKKEREKTHYKVKEYKQVVIYEMTHNQENYRGYTAIEPMYANSEDELKEKIDTWLKELIKKINKPLEQCPYCKGTGYKEKVKRIKTNNIEE